MSRITARYESYARVYAKRTVKNITCTLTEYDQKNDPDKNPKTGCGGDLSGTTGGTSYRWLRFELKNAAKNAAGFFVVGAKPIDVKLPGSKCNLLVDVVTFSPFRTTSTGTAVHYMRISSASIGVAYAQDVIVEFTSKGIELTASNGIKVECKEQ